MDRRDYLKPSRFGNAEKRRLLDNKNLKEKRSVRRTTNFNLRRDIDDIVEEVNNKTNENAPPKTNKVIDRKLALQKFRAEKEAQKKVLRDKKKPPFIVGIPHHGSSPLLRDLNNVENANKKVGIMKTTSTHEFSFQAYKLPQSEKKLTSPQTPTVLKRSVKKKPLKNVLSNLVNKIKDTAQISNPPDADEVLAAPLTSDAVAAGKALETMITGPLENACVTGTSGLIKSEQIEDEGTDNKGEENTRQDGFQMSYLKTNLRRNPKRSHRQDANEYLTAPSPRPKESTEEEGQIVAAIGETRKKNDISPPLIEARKVERKKDKENNKDEDEVAKQVALQHSRLQAETTRLLELADQWQSVVLRDSLPQEVVDEVDSMVGQTRLLTSDKFQQFRRLIVQYEQQTGTHPVTSDDLNGFWDMVYLQVESLDKKYAALDTLRNNNWVKPEPAGRKKLRPAKKLNVKKLITSEKSFTSEKQKTHLHLSEDQEIHSPTTNVKAVVNSVLLRKNQTRSNSPSPYIAMRLSGIGRTSTAMVHPPATDGTPRSRLVLAEALGTPKLTESTEKRTSMKTVSSVEVNIIEAVEETEDSGQLTATEEQSVLAITPRRSMRLVAKLQTPTPARCLACDSMNCRSHEFVKSVTKSRSTQRRARSKAVSPAEDLPETETNQDGTKEIASKGTRNSKKTLKFSPSESQQKSNTAAVAELTQPKEADISKPSTSGVRFSLRPSILAITVNNNDCEIPKKTRKRRQASAEDAEGLGVKSRSRTLQYRKVTFESGVGEKLSSKLPATPYRKSQADS